MRSHASTSDLFKGRHFEQEIIILCVRWYLRYKLSYRDLVEMMAERGVPIAHTTILRWVQRYAPEFDKRWSRFATSAGTSWRMDETYVRQDPRPMGLSLPGCRCIRQDGRLPAESTAQRRLSQSILSQGCALPTPVT